MCRTAGRDLRGASLAATDPQQIVEAIAASRSRARRRASGSIFVLTWLVLVGGLVVAIASTGRVDSAFMVEWAPFILGGIPITIFVSVISIVFATLFAVIGALGRLSRERRRSTRSRRSTCRSSAARR